VPIDESALGTPRKLLVAQLDLGGRRRVFDLDELATHRTWRLGRPSAGDEQEPGDALHNDG